MEGEYYNEFPLIIKLKEPVELKSLCIGFNAIDNTGALNRLVGVPSAVTLELGLSLDEMHS